MVSPSAFAVFTIGGPNGICHLVGQFLRFPLKGTALRTQRTPSPPLPGDGSKPTDEAGLKPVFGHRHVFASSLA
jgi:hypothetical protein